MELYSAPGRGGWFDSSENKGLVVPPGFRSGWVCAKRQKDLRVLEVLAHITLGINLSSVLAGGVCDQV